MDHVYSRITNCIHYLPKKDKVYFCLLILNVDVLNKGNRVVLSDKLR